MTEGKRILLAIHSSLIHIVKIDSDLKYSKIHSPMMRIEKYQI